MIAGVPPEKAFRLAYYSQLPDERSFFDAKADFFVNYLSGSMVHSPKLSGEIATYFEGSKVAITGFGTGLMRQLHQLHGMPEQLMPLMRNGLVNLIRSDGLDEWQRGFAIHALGDSYAHTDYDGNAFIDPYGHGKRSVRGDCPDLIAIDQEKYRAFAFQLYDALGGTSKNIDALEAFVANAINSAVRDAGLSSGENHEANNAALANLVKSGASLGWNKLPPEFRDYDPNRGRPLWRLSESERHLKGVLPDPSADDVGEMLQTIWQFQMRQLLTDPLGKNCNY